MQYLPIKLCYLVPTIIPTKKSQSKFTKITGYWYSKRSLKICIQNIIHGVQCIHVHVQASTHTHVHVHAVCTHTVRVIIPV